MNPLSLACYIEGSKVVEEQLKCFTDFPIQLSFFRLGDFRNLDHDKIKMALRERNISIRSIHLPTIDVTHRDFLGVLTMLQEKYEQNIFTLHPQSSTKERAIRSLEEISLEVLQRGITLAYENFPNSEKKWISSPEDICSLNFPFTGLTFDTSHYGTPRGLLRTAQQCLGGLKVIHLSNSSNGINPQQHLPFERGNLPLINLCKFLRNCYDGEIVLDYPNPQVDILKIYSLLDRSSLQTRCYTDLEEKYELTAKEIIGNSYWKNYYDERGNKVRQERVRTDGIVDITFAYVTDKKGKVKRKYFWNEGKFESRRDYKTDSYFDYDRTGREILFRLANEL